MYRVSPLPLTFTFNCVDGNAVDLVLLLLLILSMVLMLMLMILLVMFLMIFYYAVDIVDVGDCDETSSPSFLHSLVKEDASAG